MQHNLNTAFEQAAKDMQTPTKNPVDLQDIGLSSSKQLTKKDIFFKYCSNALFYLYGFEQGKD